MNKCWFGQWVLASSDADSIFDVTGVVFWLVGFLSPDADYADYTTDSAFGRAAPNGRGSTDEKRIIYTSSLTFEKGLFCLQNHQYTWMYLLFLMKRTCILN